MQAFEFIGSAPALDGKVCEGFVCESHRVNGTTIATAAVTYVKSCGIWHLLCFDPGIVHWRALAERPEPQSFEDTSLEFLHADIGSLADVLGRRLVSCKFSTFETGMCATFVFENGRQIVIKHAQNLTSYSYGLI